MAALKPDLPAELARRMDRWPSTHAALPPRIACSCTLLGMCECHVRTVATITKDRMHVCVCQCSVRSVLTAVWIPVSEAYVGIRAHPSSGSADSCAHPSLGSAHRRAYPSPASADSRADLSPGSAGSHADLNLALKNADW